MRIFSLKNAVIASAIGMFGIVGSASAQNANEEYREWQRAQQIAQRECYDYQRSGSRSDYRDCQQAQQRAQREQLEYQQARSGRYNNGYRNNGYYNNNGYNNGVTVNRYRVYRNGSYYETNQRGAELLRQAVNSGYQQGYRQGQMDRSYGRGGSYYGNSIYNSGTYGYQSYVDRSQYQYYFQQGFQRGYEDGYNSRTQYGYRNGSSYNILGTILNGILQLSQ
jgi:hypothetical protein